MADAPPLLTVKNLHVRTVEGDKHIVKGVNLVVRPNEVHAIMGPNGSGKSTFAQSIAGHYAYNVTEGEVSLNGKDLLSLRTDERANEGLFLGLQYPMEIPGVNNELRALTCVVMCNECELYGMTASRDFLRSALNHKLQGVLSFDFYRDDVKAKLGL